MQLWGIKTGKETYQSKIKYYNYKQYMFIYTIITINTIITNNTCLSSQFFIWLKQHFNINLCMEIKAAIYLPRAINEFKVIFGTSHWYWLGGIMRSHRCWDGGRACAVLSPSLAISWLTDCHHHHQLVGQATVSFPCQSVWSEPWCWAELFSQAQPGRQHEGLNNYLEHIFVIYL